MEAIKRTVHSFWIFNSVYLLNYPFLFKDHSPTCIKNPINWCFKDFTWLTLPPGWHWAQLIKTMLCVFLHLFFFPGGYHGFRKLYKSNCDGSFPKNTFAHTVLILISPSSASHYIIQYVGLTVHRTSVSCNGVVHRGLMVLQSVLRKWNQKIHLFCCKLSEIHAYFYIFSWNVWRLLLYDGYLYAFESHIQNFLIWVDSSIHFIFQKLLRFLHLFTFSHSNHF